MYREMSASRFKDSMEKCSDIDQDSICTDSYLCTTCETKGLVKEALYFCADCSKQLCETCLDMHKSFTKNHKELGKKDVGKWEVVKPDLKKDFCQTHKGHVEQMYCVDHNEVGCVFCHRRCKYVKHIPTESRGFMQNTKYKDLPTIVKGVNIKLDSLKDAKLKSLSEISNLFGELTRTIDKIKQRATEESNKVTTIIKTDINSCETIQGELKQLIDDREKKKDQTDEYSAYIQFMNSKKRTDDAETLLQRMAKEDYKIDFQVDTLIDEFLSSVQRFGEFVINTADYVYTKLNAEKYSVKVDNETETCSISGICLMPDESTIITDYNNEKVKHLDVKFKVITHCDLSNARDICHIKDSEVAVAVNGMNNGQIHFFRARNRKLDHIKEVKLSNRCLTIAHNNGQLFTTSGSKIYVHDLDGKIQKILYESKEAATFHPVARIGVSDNGNIIYVTNLDKNLLRTLGKTGSEVTALGDKDMDHPSDVCVAMNGTVFVCGETSNTVIQVDKAGNKKLSTLANKADGLCKPLSLCFNSKTNRLIVGQADNSILVFTLK